jgi:hypothetical protein
MDQFECYVFSNICTESYKLLQFFSSNIVVEDMEMLVGNDKHMWLWCPGSARSTLASILSVLPMRSSCSVPKR